MNESIRPLVEKHRRDQSDILALLASEHNGLPLPPQPPSHVHPGAPPRRRDERPPVVQNTWSHAHVVSSSDAFWTSRNSHVTGGR